MRLPICVVAAVALLLSLGVAAQAGFVPCDNWRMKIKVDNGGLSAGVLTVGTAPGASDGYDGYDMAYEQFGSGAGVIACTDIPANQYNPSGLWCADIQSPFTHCGDFRIWNLMAYVNGASSGNLTLNAWMSSSGKLTGQEIVLAVYDGVVTPGTFRSRIPLWRVPYGTSGSSTDPQYTYKFSYSGGFRQFTVLAYIEPEPCSMVALACGLVGFGGIAWRRRVR